jgi:RNA polymerase sigma-70 factor (ECF subfamily)
VVHEFVIGPRKSRVPSSNGAGEQRGSDLRDLVGVKLVEQAAAGDAEAFAALVRGHYDTIYRVAWRWLGSREDAEDVAQNVCVSLARAIRTFRFEAEFSTWLYRLTYNASLDFLRARQRSRRHEDPAVVLLFTDRAVEAAEASAMQGDIWNEVRGLPDKQRDAVLLVYAEDMSHAEAASVMGCSEKTVSWHLHEARKRLKSRLQEAG